MRHKDVPAVLSVRLPATSRDQLKAAAAVRGETVQGLVGTLVDRFLAEEERPPPQLAAALRAVRTAAPALRTRGVRGLWIDGAVARGTALPGAAVDLLYEFEAEARVSLVGLASLRAELSMLLDAAVDLAERAADGARYDDAVRAL